MDPDDQSIRTFLDFAPYAGRANAVAFLKGNNNNLEEAVNAYFTNPDPARFEKQLVPTQWSENEFSNDRYGADNHGSNPPSYQLDDLSYEKNDLTSLTAPSRPPSRTSGAVHNEYVSARSVPHSRNWGAQDETTNQRLPPQETGVTSAAWPAEETWRTLVPDLDVIERERKQGEPVFLKPLPQADPLPSLLTILSHTPQARQQLIALDHVFEDYGSHPEWWKGEEIESPSIAWTEASEDDCQSHHMKQDIIKETQRLMAFLLKSERVYGSAEALSHLRRMEPSEASSGSRQALFVRFMKAWSFAMGKDALFNSILSSDQHGQEDVSQWALELDWKHIPQKENVSLVNALDNTLWSKTMMGGRTGSDYSFSSVASILCIGLPPSTQGVQVPASLFMDRYMTRNSHVIGQMRDKESQYLHIINRTEESLGKLQKVVHPRKINQTTKLFDYTLSHLQENNNDPQGQDREVQEVSQKLERVWESVQGRLSVLEQQKLQCQEAIQNLSGILSGSDRVVMDGQTFEPTMRYDLRGFSQMRKETLNTYVNCHEDSNSTGPNWWRLTYEHHRDPAQVKRERIEEPEALSAACQSGEFTTLLVYASDTMNSHDGVTELPNTLNQFIEDDNVNFRKELESLFQSQTQVMWDESPQRSPDLETGERAPQAYDEPYPGNFGHESSQRSSRSSMEVQKDDDDDDEDDIMTWSSPRQDTGTSSSQDAEAQEMQEVKKEQSAGLGAMGGWRDSSRSQSKQQKGGPERLDSDTSMIG